MKNMTVVKEIHVASGCMLRDRSHSLTAGLPLCPCRSCGMKNGFLCVPALRDVSVAKFRRSRLISKNNFVNLQ